MADYATWRAVHDAGKDLKERSGVTGAEVFVDPKEPNAVVVVVTRFESLASLQAFASNTELAEAMKQGVIVPRSVTVGVRP